MKKFRLHQILSISLIIMSLGWGGCSAPENPPGPSETIKINLINLPNTVHTLKGGTFSFEAEGFISGDKIKLQGDNSQEYTITPSINGTNISFSLPAELTSQRYQLFVIRGDKTNSFGWSRIVIVANTDVPDKEGMNIKGLVTNGGVPIANVVISDGIEVTKTDEDGIYYLASTKKHGYVFMTIPGNYEAPVEKGIPQFFKYLSSFDRSVIERADFTLTPVNNENHVILAMTDQHLANRTRDIEQFKTGFLQEAQSFITNTVNSGRRVYAVTMGDNTWDNYWYENLYDLPKYIDEYAPLGCPIFNSMGNHDNDRNGKNLSPGDAGYVSDPNLAYQNTSDWVSSNPYRQIVGPTYYSFNIGKAHYMSVDDMICTNQGTADSRNTIAQVDDDQMKWIKNNLAQITDKNTPVFVMMHIPLHTQPTVTNTYTIRMTNGTEFIKCFEGFKEVHILTGHTHDNYNVISTNNAASVPLFYEHNTAALSGTWWWTGNTNYTNSVVAPDGAPGGYCIYEINGTDVKWKYKGVKKDINYQFRTYDLNHTVLLPATYVPNADATYQTAWKSNTWAGQYQTAAANKILINVWNWDPDWTIKVTEGVGAAATELTATRVSRKDPLQLISYPAIRMNRSNTTPTYSTTSSTHMFEVQASSSTNEINIVVTDRFGNEYKETMVRPKQIRIDMD